MLKKSEQLAERYGCKLNLGFSGGKDSVVLKYFADYYGIDYVSHFNNTQIEKYKGMIRFIKTNYPDVKIIHPSKENSFFELMKRKGIPSLFRRWCCEFLKHSNPKLSGYLVNVMGVRGEESRARFERGAVNIFGTSKRAKKTIEKIKLTFANEDSQVQCEGGKDKVNIYPIFDLTEKEVFEIIKTENLIIPDAYKNCKRIGCAFCPFMSFSESIRTIKERPNLAKAWIRTLGGDFIMRSQRNISGKTDEIGLFYLYISKFLLTTNRLHAGLRYLNEKDAFGQTGHERFKRFLQENNVIE
ncbi:MAG: phosphoadenosine phosphosulfate reductase family protein [Prevotellaceae bacterium]|nr:phosphoadenosine phosphosulfate reductase family protein [Prevotellaceae bacterium]